MKKDSKETVKMQFAAAKIARAILARPATINIIDGTDGYAEIFEEGDREYTVIAVHADGTRTTLKRNAVTIGDATYAAIKFGYNTHRKPSRKPAR